MDGPWVPKGILVCLLVALLPCAMLQSLASGARDRIQLREEARRMFYHAYDNYMQYAFPHDELKPLSRTYTDSLAELGNLNHEHLPEHYNGTALTLVESLSSLAILGNATEFVKAVLWLGENLSFDVDVRVNLFECNIRLLGGLISAHLLAIEFFEGLIPGGYKNQLLHLADDLGQRLLPAFETPTGIPYAWINLKYGVMMDETLETSTSGCGTLILEMGALSRLTRNSKYEDAALKALRKLWSMRSSLDLMGTTLNVATGTWIQHSSGIGAGVDSFYEYLLKAHILFGGQEYWDMFRQAYVAVQQYFRHGPWYHEADMRTGRATYWQLTSLQAFWPSVQVLIGDVVAANATHREFVSVWEKHGVIPERYLLDIGSIHPTESYYPLRPELAESTLYLYQATKDPWYLDVGCFPLRSISGHPLLTFRSYQPCTSRVSQPAWCVLSRVSPLSSSRAARSNISFPTVMPAYFGISRRGSGTELTSMIRVSNDRTELVTDEDKCSQTESRLLTLPTVLTLGRIAAIPVLIIVFYSNQWWASIAVPGIFVLAALTDWLDGFLARKMGSHSSFGAFLDPVADKLMVATTLVLLSTQPLQASWASSLPWLIPLPSVAIIGREITMSAVREWAASQSGDILSAVAVNKLGKWKTASQMVALTILLATRSSCEGSSWYMLIVLGVSLLYISAGLALLSLAVYMKGIWGSFVK